MIVSGRDHAPMPCPCLGAVLIIILQTKLYKINICILSNSHLFIVEENIHNPYIYVRSQNNLRHLFTSKFSLFQLLPYSILMLNLP